MTQTATRTTTRGDERVLGCGAHMRLPSSAHRSRDWRIDEFTRDFRIEDVWDLPVTFGPDDFPRLVQLIAALDLSNSSSAPVRALVAIRWKLGELFRWDATEPDVGAGVPTLRDRLPTDLRDGSSGPTIQALPFSSLYLTDDEWAAEAANGTMHGVIHVGRIPNDAGDFGAQMAIVVKPNGPLGTAYMAAIKPFRYLIVYPWLLHEIGRQWRTESLSTSEHDAAT